MDISPSKINAFLFFKLPAAFFCGVRVVKIENTLCTVAVTHKWINQNPFKSMYFAVQSMAAELSTGVLIMHAIKNSGADLSMLVVSVQSKFVKKATGRITFTCTSDKISEAINSAISTGESQSLLLNSTGKNSDQEIVSIMDIEWRIKLKKTNL